MEKLSSLMECNGRTLDDGVVRERRSVPEMMQDCWVSPFEAVSDWNVLPEGMIIAPSETHEGLIIRHVDLNCALPGLYQTLKAAQVAMSQLLVGHKLVGSGSLTYRGQPMTLLEALDLDELPHRPEMAFWAEPAEPGSLHLADATFREGFAPLNEPLFRSIRAEEENWSIHFSGMQATVRAGYAEVFTRYPNMSSLNVKADDAADEDRAEAMRQAYPELWQVNASSLMHWGQAYCRHIAFTERAISERDEELLIYLLGILAEGESPQIGAMDAGWAASFALLSCVDLARALAFGREVEQYQGALRDLTYRVTRILDRLEHDDALEVESKETNGLNSLLRVIMKSGSGAVH